MKYGKIRPCIAAVFIIAVTGCSSGPFTMSQRQASSLLERSSVKVNTVFGNRVVTFGSGFLLSDDGLIGTNFHVVELAVMKKGKVFVEFLDQNTKREARVFNWDKSIDFAIIKIDTAGINGTESLNLGDSDRIKPLDSIYVAGFPVTGAFKAQKGELNSFQKLYGRNYLDISIPIDKGNSGGPLVDSRGKLVGISVAFMIAARSMNLAIPVNDVKQLIRRSISGARKLVLWDGREIESNDSIAQSNLLAQGLLIDGHLGDGDEEDWYEISGQEGNYPRITISHLAVNNFDFEVYSDNELAGKATGASPQDVIQCGVPGRCYLRVYRVSGSGDYTLQISSQPRLANDAGQEMEPNDTRFMATLSRSFNLIGSLRAGDDEDWFELAGQEGVTPTFQISHDERANFNLEVYSDNDLACRSLGGAGSERISCQVPGKCFVRVHRVSGEGGYAVRIETGGGSIPPGY